ncbi:MAG: hypothetical protein ACI4M6_06870 [Christensenellaceae bacterium]
MTDGKLLIEKLLVFAKFHFNMSEFDVNYMRNLLLCAFELGSPLNGDLSDKEIQKIQDMTLPDELFSECCDYAKTRLDRDEVSSERFATYIFGLISPLPSKVNNQFVTLRETRGAEVACRYLYDLSVKNNYIQKTKLDKNEFWEYKKDKNRLELTINLAKPEKDNKDVAKTLTQNVNDKYPKCQLCRENIGFIGSDGYPSRVNLRSVDLTLNKEKWFLQYSPFGYINEHSILVTDEHKPMKTDGDMIDSMFDFIEYIPDYFVASNSDLPIIGGSILNHRHFQCGKKSMPLFEARPYVELKCEDYEDVEISLTDWYCTDIRISGYNRNTIKELFSSILEGWLKFSDESNNIYNGESELRNNSATVVARYLNDGKYAVDLVLRNNAVDGDNPYGIYHVPEVYHNIKKEALGLMEIMGVFILPGRLKSQIKDLTEILCDKSYDLQQLQDKLNPLYPHRFLAESIVSRYGFFSDESKAEAAILEYIGEACSEMLANAGVYNKSPESVFALKTFLAKFNIR